nr:1133_t:CDS:2 [Entrophospora candida]
MESENTPIMREEGDKKVYLFIDNSNLFIEGKYSVGHLEKLGTIDKKRGTHYYDLIRIEHGQLLNIVQNGRPLSANPFLVGSKPPSEDSMWKYIRELGFDVAVYKRNSQDREKKVDVRLACAMQKTIEKNTPGVLVLIAGDGDYEYPIVDAIENNWIVEVWFWKSATSNDFQKKDFRQLDCHYKIFTYGDEHTPNEKVYTLELINEKLEKWTNIEAMQSSFEGEEEDLDVFEEGTGNFINRIEHWVELIQNWINMINDNEDISDPLEFIFVDPIAKWSLCSIFNDNLESPDFVNSFD